MNRYNDLKKEYLELQDLICEAVPDYDVTEGRIQSYLLASAFTIWAANVNYAPEYAKAVEAIAEASFMSVYFRSGRM